MKIHGGRYLETQAAKICFLFMIFIWVLELTVGAAKGIQLGIVINDEFYRLEKQRYGLPSYNCYSEDGMFSITKVSENRETIFYNILVERDGETLSGQAEVRNEGAQKLIRVYDSSLIWEGVYDTQENRLTELEIAGTGDKSWVKHQNAEKLASILAGDLDRKWDYYFGEGALVVMIAPLAGIMMILFREQIAKFGCVLSEQCCRIRNSERETKLQMFWPDMILAVGIVIYFASIIFGGVLLKS